MLVYAFEYLKVCDFCKCVIPHLLISQSDNFKTLISVRVYKKECYNTCNLQVVHVVQLILLKRIEGNTEQGKLTR